MTSQFEIAGPLLEQAEGMAKPGSHFLGQVAAAQAFLARSKRDNPRTIEKSEQALALLPEADIANRGIIAMNLGLAYWHVGQLAEAEPVLLQACDLCGKYWESLRLADGTVIPWQSLRLTREDPPSLEMDEGLIQIRRPDPHPLPGTL